MTLKCKTSPALPSGIINLSPKAQPSWNRRAVSRKPHNLDELPELHPIHLYPIRDWNIFWGEDCKYSRNVSGKEMHSGSFRKCGICMQFCL